MDKREIRVGIPVEIRAEEDGGVRVEGYAAVFGEEANIGGMFVEVIERGAFSQAIGRDDVVFLINHEGLPLARTRSGTLTLEEDDRGLLMGTRLDPDDPDAKRIIGKMKRGDLDKMSFAFIADRQEWDDTVDPPRRTIKEASLFDVSVVTTPAYDGTEIGLRSLDMHRKEKDEERKRREENFAAARERIRQKKKLKELELSKRS